MSGTLWYKLRTKLAELFAPVEFRCIGCGKDVFDEVGFCDECRTKLPFNNGKTCKRCGVAIDGEEDYCGNCVEEKMYFDRAYSAFVYDGIERTQECLQGTWFFLRKSKVYSTTLSLACRCRRLRTKSADTIKRSCLRAGFVI